MNRIRMIYGSFPLEVRTNKEQSVSNTLLKESVERSEYLNHGHYNTILFIYKLEIRIKDRVSRILGTLIL